ncbi:hypothetical protein [Streptomyces aidingensis]|uniref:Uncharacterized protein n=1 Tax=Streptomyces aidingensis TaxID=910347 RepID=A0A1I1PXT8_9ACTN|nr:hypothetical protein [Streptomyces aidingensis]SFD14659.1 hypothetical protein SAMN05421773_110134 [Streptomyces aidingensis]
MVTVPELVAVEGRRLGLDERMVAEVYDALTCEEGPGRPWPDDDVVQVMESLIVPDWASPDTIAAIVRGVVAADRKELG